MSRIKAGLELAEEIKEEEKLEEIQAGPTEETVEEFHEESLDDVLAAIDESFVEALNELDDDNVIRTKFAQKQAAKNKTPYYKNPDIEVPMYNPVKGTAWDAAHSKNDPQEPFASFKMVPAGKTAAHIIGVTEDGDAVEISTAHTQLAKVLVDAYNRGGFTDQQIEKVNLSDLQEGIWGDFKRDFLGSKRADNAGAYFNHLAQAYAGRNPKLSAYYSIMAGRTPSHIEDPEAFKQEVESNYPLKMQIDRDLKDAKMSAQSYTAENAISTIDEPAYRYSFYAPMSELGDALYSRWVHLVSMFSDIDVGLQGQALIPESNKADFEAALKRQGISKKNWECDGMVNKKVTELKEPDYSDDDAEEYLRKLNPKNVKKDYAKMLPKGHTNLYKKFKQLKESYGHSLRLEARRAKYKGDMIRYHKLMKDYHAHMSDAMDANARSARTPWQMQVYRRQSKAHDKSYNLHDMKLDQEYENMRNKYKPQVNTPVNEISDELVDRYRKGKNDQMSKIIGKANGNKDARVFNKDDVNTITKRLRGTDLDIARNRRKIGIPNKKWLSENPMESCSYRVLCTLRDSNGTMVTKRNEGIMKTVRVNASSDEQAVTKAKKFYKQKGYSVMNAEVVGKQSAVGEQINEDYESRVDQIVKLMMPRMAYPWTKEDLARAITSSAFSIDAPEVKMERNKKELLKDVYKKLKPHIKWKRANAAPAKPKLNLRAIGQMVMDTVGQAFPDGDPIDVIIPRLRKMGVNTDAGVEPLLDKALKSIGYKGGYYNTLADFWDEMKAQIDYDAKNGHQSHLNLGDRNPWRIRESVIPEASLKDVWARKAKEREAKAAAAKTANTKLFKKVDWDEFERLAADSSNYEETSCNGHRIWVIWDGENCIASYYPKEKFGTYNPNFKGDDVSYNETDPYYPQSMMEASESANPKDRVSLDIPLLIRLLEYAREDAKTDMDLHDLTEKLINMSSEAGKTLSMADYEALVGQAAGDQDSDEPAQINESFVIHKISDNGYTQRQVPKLSFKTKKEAKAEVDKRMKARSEYDKEQGIKFEYRKGNDGKLLKPARTSKAKKIGLKEGFRNSYSVGDRVMTPTGTGTIVWVSPKVNVDDMVRVKLDDPSQAGDDGKDKDTFRYTTSMLKFLKEAKNPAMARAKSVAKMAKNAPSFKKTMAKKTVKEGKSEDQLDDEFDREMRKLDKMLKNGEITHEEYKEEERALRRELNS